MKVNVYKGVTGKTKFAIPETEYDHSMRTNSSMITLLGSIDLAIEPVKEELLMYPFCGGQAVIGDRNHTHEKRYFVWCYTCFNGTEDVISEELAIKRWNTRWNGGR